MNKHRSCKPKKKKKRREAHTHNLYSQEAETARFPERPALYTNQVLGQPGLQSYQPKVMNT